MLDRENALAYLDAFEAFVKTNLDTLTLEVREQITKCAKFEADLITAFIEADVIAEETEAQLKAANVRVDELEAEVLDLESELADAENDRNYDAGMAGDLQEEVYSLEIEVRELENNVAELESEIKKLRNVKE